MEKISDSKKNTMQKLENSTKDNKKNSTFYRLQLICREKRNDARISLPIFEGGGNPRLTACSTISGEDAVIKLLEKVKIELIKGIEQNYIVAENLFNIFDNISLSIKELNMQTDRLLSCFHNVVSNIYGFLNNQVIAPVKSVTPNLFQVDNKMELYKVDNKKIDSYKLDINSPVKPIPTEKEALTFKDVAIKWFKYKYSFTIQSKDNVNPLSKKTLEGYNKIMNSRIIPFFIKNKNIDDISDIELQQCIDNTNGDRHKEAVYVVLKMILDYAMDNNHISYSRTVKKPPKVKKKTMIKIEGHELIYIKSSRQSYWLDCFEKEGTDVAYLFESMLLAGLRPEEACGLDWTCLIEDAHYFFIRDAYKDFPVYNENAEIIGHVRGYDALKTDDSYRKIPVHPRYREILLKHKEKQKALFKKMNMKWIENTPMFLNRFHQAYVAENLAKALKRIREKYNLEYLTPYGLRHSFATFLSENGMRDVVLMKLMGHSSYLTTQKYYIFVSDERKKYEYEQAWGIRQDNDFESNTKNKVSMQIFEQLQSLWLETLNNAIVA